MTTEYVDNKSREIFADVDPEVAQIKAKTDNLPSDPADASDVAASIAAVNNLVSSSESKGTYTYTNSGGEQTIVTITTTARKLIDGIWLDLVNMTQSGTIKLYYKVDGTNYREVTSFYFDPSTDSDCLFMNLSMGITDDLKVTYTEATDEGADRDIKFSVVFDVRE